MMLEMLLFEKLEVYHLPQLPPRSPRVKDRDDKDQVDLDDKTPMVPTVIRVDRDRVKTDQHEEEGQIQTKLKRLRMGSKLLEDQEGTTERNKLLPRLKQRRMLLFEKDSRSLLPLDLWRIPREVMIRRMRVRTSPSV
jgi:hypothetical protein